MTDLESEMKALKAEQKELHDLLINNRKAKCYG